MRTITVLFLMSMLQCLQVLPAKTLPSLLHQLDIAIYYILNYTLLWYSLLYYTVTLLLYYTLL